MNRLTSYKVKPLRNASDAEFFKHFTECLDRECQECVCLRWKHYQDEKMFGFKETFQAWVEYSISKKTKNEN